MLSDEIKKQIDEMDYRAMLCKWRFAPAGDPMFTGEVGDYYSKVMAKKRAANPAGAVADSKSIGWD